MHAENFNLHYARTYVARDALSAVKIQTTTGNISHTRGTFNNWNHAHALGEAIDFMHPTTRFY